MHARQARFHSGYNGHSTSATMMGAAMSFIELARARYSCRTYEHRPVEQEHLDLVLEAGRIAPSAHNNHPTRVIVCDTPELRAKAAKAAYRFERDGSVFGAPVVLIACAITDEA